MAAPLLMASAFPSNGLVAGRGSGRGADRSCAAAACALIEPSANARKTASLRAVRLMSTSSSLHATNVTVAIYPETGPVKGLCAVNMGALARGARHRQARDTPSRLVGSLERKELVTAAHSHEARDENAVATVRLRDHFEREGVA